MPKIIHYNPRLKELAKKLRNESTLSEVLLWSYLKNKKVLGYKFIRQKPIDNFIVDFFNIDLMLAIEIDGCTHGDKINYDKKRQEILEKLGIKFIRFNDSDVKSNIYGVVERIKIFIDKHELHTPPFGHPSREGNLIKYLNNN